VKQDPRTFGYFEERCPEYTDARLIPAVEAIAGLPGPPGSLADIGCGNGNILELIRNRTEIRRLVGVDTNLQALARVREQYGFETRAGSILDEDFVRSAEGEYDVVLLGAVLHHLVAKTRSTSAELALAALQHAARIVKPGGHVVVAEPVYAPAWAMGMVFWLKRVVSAVTSNRVELGRWNNIGAPVVSFYTLEQLCVMAESSGFDVSATHEQRLPLPPLLRVTPIRSRANATLVLKRPG
jgi:SAM-dependent methyltransferase